MSDLAVSFDPLRPHLPQVAYGTLGSVSEAEDVVQDAWLRLKRADAAQIEDLRAWLTTVVARPSLAAATGGDLGGGKRPAGYSASEHATQTGADQRGGT